MRTAASLCLLATSAVSLAAVTKPPKGFVTTEGTKFKLDGKDFFFAGSNAYYFPFNNVSMPESSLHSQRTAKESDSR